MKHRWGMNWVHLQLALIISIELSLQWNLGRKIHKYLPRIIVSSIEIWLVKPSCWEYACNSWYTSILFSKGQTRAHFPWKFCTLKLLKLCIEAWSRTLTILRGFAGVFSTFPSVFEPCRGLWNIVVIWRCWKSLLDLFISKAVVESQFLFIIFWAVLSLESLAILWTCSLYQNESIPLFFSEFSHGFLENLMFQCTISLNGNFLKNGLLNFNEILSGSLPSWYASILILKKEGLLQSNPS